MYEIIKAAISGILIFAISETARRSPAIGALVASLPLVSVLAMVWMWRETGDSERIAAYSQAMVWYILPSLPMFLVLPVLLRAGVQFYAALALSCILTAILYLAMAWMLRRFGIGF